MKKIIAVIFLQLYLVSVFGLTLHQQFCCDMHILDECHPHEMNSDMLSDHTEGDEHCPICTLAIHDLNSNETNSLEYTDESCCTDCQSLTITVSESKKQQIELTNLLAATSYKFQPAELVMAWIPDLMRIPDPSTPYSSYNPLSTPIPDQIPIFIRDCTYRL